MENYVGKLIFVESSDPNNGYYNGEYICVKQSENAVYCVKPISGYYGHELKTFYLIGSKCYKIISSNINIPFIENFIKELEEFSNIKENRQWVESVYNGAKENVRLLKEALSHLRALIKKDNTHKELTSILPIYRWYHNETDHSHFICDNGEWTLWYDVKNTLMIILSLYKESDETKLEIIRQLFNIPK